MLTNRKWLIVLLLTILIGWIYSPVLKNNFVNYDDPHYVYENALIK